MQRRGDGHPERRGQVILVAAIGIALTLITMGMVLSAVALPQQWWSSENVDSVDSVSATDAIVEGYGSALFSANYENQFGYNELEQEFTVNGRFWVERYARLQNAAGQTTNGTVVDTTNGTRIAHGKFGNFTAKNGDESWTLVENAKVRRFAMNISTRDLAQVSDVVGDGGDEAGDGGGEGDEGGGDLVDSLAESNAFRITTVVDGTERTVYFYRTQDDDDPDNQARITLVYENNSFETRTVTQDYFKVDLTEHVIAGTKTPWFPGFSPPYERVEFTNTDRVKGRYLLITNHTESTINASYHGDSLFHDTCLKSPCIQKAIYSGTVRASFDSRRVDYETTLTVAPEDPDLTFPSPSIHHRVVFWNDVNGKLLASIKNNTSAVNRHVTDMEPKVFAPAKYDLDHNGKADIPYIDNTQSLRLVDVSSTNVQNGNRVLLRAGGEGVKNALIGVGDFDQDGYPEVYYNEDDDIYKINAIPGDSEDYYKKEGPTLVKTGEQLGGALRGIVGVANIDGSGEPELIYTTKESEVMYIQPGGTPVKLLNKSMGLKSGRSIGSPADFYRNDSALRIPVIRQDEGLNIFLLGPDGGLSRVVKNPNLQGAPVASSDIDTDGQMEIVYASKSDSELVYVEVDADTAWDNVTIYPVLNAQNESVNAKKGKGAR